MFASRDPERTRLQVLLILLAALSMGAWVVLVVAGHVRGVADLLPRILPLVVVAYAALGAHEVLRHRPVVNCERWSRGGGEVLDSEDRTSE
ncbi:hypothetical protein GCM10009854_37510 [Saccharopolyspora halophila]|uniref:Uncharacterized protein n=1 Tax=Saccharopolyspora halophila TaxID=405551 RepID=A0ABP5TPV2_9PSEU